MGEPSQGSFYPRETAANHPERSYLRNAPTGGFLAQRQDCERHILSKGHGTAHKSHHKNDCWLCLLLKTAPILVFTGPTRSSFHCNLNRLVVLSSTMRSLMRKRGAPHSWYGDCPGRAQSSKPCLLWGHPRSRPIQALCFRTPQCVSIISTGVPHFPINLQAKLILTSLISLNCIVTIITYTPFVRLLRKYFERNKPTGK